MLNVAARVASLFASLLSIRFAVQGFGTERFGIWTTIASISMILSFTDFGVSNGMVSAIARHNATNSRDEVRRVIQAGIAVVSLFGLAVSIIGLIAVSAVDWRSLLHLSSEPLANEAKTALQAAIALIAIGLVTSPVPRIQTGMQESHIWPKWQLAASVTSVIAVYLVSTMRCDLWCLVVALLGPSCCAGLANAAVYFGRRPDLILRSWRLDLKTAHEVIRVGFLFFILQLAAALTTSSDVLLVSNVMGPVAAAEYSIHQRLFAVGGSVLSMALSPLWPAYADARAREDHRWIDRTRKYTTWGALSAGFMLSMLLILLGPTLIHLWVGSRIQPDSCLLAAFGVWLVLECWGAAMAAYLNGMSVVRAQVFLNIAFLVICLLLRYVLIQHAGLCGVPIATALAYSSAIFIPYMFLLGKIAGPHR